MGGWIIRVQTKPTTVFVSSDTEDEIKLDKKDVVIVFFKIAYKHLKCPYSFTYFSLLNICCSDTLMTDFSTGFHFLLNGGKNACHAVSLGFNNTKVQNKRKTGLKSFPLPLSEHVRTKLREQLL